MDEDKDEKDKDAILVDIIANTVVLVSTGSYAHPQASEVLHSLQASFTHLLALTLGDAWVAEHEAQVDGVIQTRMLALKAGVEASASKRPIQ